MYPIRVLHVVTTMDFGGVETLLMSIYRKMDRKLVQFDFLCHNTTDCKFSQEIEALGGRVFSIPGPNHSGPARYQRDLYEFFLAHPENRIVHSHINLRNGVVLNAARRAGIPYRISHSHISGGTYPLRSRLYKAYAQYLARNSISDRFACSEEAAEYLFGSSEHAKVIRNAIDAERFLYSDEKRRAARAQLQLADDAFVIGMVGRFAEQKNYPFGVSVFARVLQKRPDAKMVLIGNGELVPAIRQQVADLGITQSVLFAGQFSDMDKYYAAMDVFLFPSLYEGLGIVAVEAQCSGLRVVASDTVPQIARVTDRMQFLSLEQPLEDWADACLSAGDRLPPAEALAAVRAAGYDVKEVAGWLQDYYLAHWSER